MELKDWLGLALAVAQTLYAIATFHRDKLTLSPTNRPLIVMAIFTLLSWTAVGFQFFSRPSAPVGGLINYGTVSANTFQGVGVLNKWADFRNFRAMLIMRTNLANRDRMTDDWIAKSIPYTINQPIISMVAVTNNEMRFAPGQINYIEFNFVVIPSKISAEQIRILDDVDKLGGQIISSSAQGVPVPPLESAPSK